MRVRTAPTPAAHWGVYDHQHRLVTLTPGLGPVQYRSTLAHELGHAHYGHTGHLPKNENHADQWAARALLSFEMLYEAARLPAGIPELAAELDVLPWVVKSFVNTLGLEETEALLERAQGHLI